MDSESYGLGTQAFADIQQGGDLCHRLATVSDVTLRNAFKNLCANYSRVCDRLVRNKALKEEDYTRVQQIAHKAFDAGVIPHAFVAFFDTHRKRDDLVGNAGRYTPAQEITQHSLEVAVLSSRMGMEMYPGNDEMQVFLLTAGLFHDVGKFLEADLHGKRNKLLPQQFAGIRERIATMYPARAEDGDGYHPTALRYAHALRLANERGNSLCDEQTQEVLGALYTDGILRDEEAEALRSDFGNLTSSELLRVKNHTLDGYRFLKAHSTEQGDLAHKFAVVALTHHMGYDGRGYPQIVEGIPAGDLVQPDYCRIVQVADILSALTGERSYRQSISVPEVLARFQRPYRQMHSGVSNGGMEGQVDPDVVDVLMKLVACETHALDNYTTSDVDSIHMRTTRAA